VTAQFLSDPRSAAPAAQNASTTGPTTLAIDIGGSGLKASVLDAAGAMLVDRVRVKTEYPCPPEALVQRLHALVRPLPSYDRVSVGFPGMVRAGRVHTAPNLATVAGPGTKVSPDLVRAWQGFDLASALEAELGRPTRVVNDAELQGSAAIEGKGVELVITLGTGFGTALFNAGAPCPHLEIAHQPFRKHETYEEQLGDVARRRIGGAKWNRRLKLAVKNMDALILYDRLHIGGGNSRRVQMDLGPRVTLVDNTAGILGGIRLWERPIV
jgi:polyphosphate glucokinase